MKAYALLGAAVAVAVVLLAGCFGETARQKAEREARDALQGRGEECGRSLIAPESGWRRALDADIGRYVANHADPAPWIERWQKGCVIYRKELTYDENSCRTHFSYKLEGEKLSVDWKSVILRGDDCERWKAEYLAQGWTLRRVR